MITERQGNLFTSQAHAFGHGVNTHGFMGAGIALQFKMMYPQMYRAYKDRCENKRLNPGGVYVWPTDSQPAFIYNIASQDMPGPHARLEWLLEGLTTTFDHAVAHNLASIAIPQIGCGIGGLDFEEIRPDLTKLCDSFPLDVELWTYAPSEVGKL